MPVNKNAMLRYRIIDSCLTNKMRRYPTLQDIIERIESQMGTSISVSMINKDLKQMRDLYDAPIKYSHTQGGYFYTEENFSILDAPLSPDEIEALDYSTALLNTIKGTHLFRHFENAINKLIDGYRISSYLDKLPHHILQVEQPLSDGGSYWLNDVLQSIVSKKTMRFAYKRFGSEEREYVFSPYLIKEYRNRWYMLGMVHAYNALRVFALDRLQDIYFTDEPYIETENFNPDEYFKYSFGITQLNHIEPIEAKLFFTPQLAHYIRSMPLHPSQEILQDDETGMQIKLHVYLTYELVMAILSYGKDVLVLEPPELIERVKSEIMEMRELYN